MSERSDAPAPLPAWTNWAVLAALLAFCAWHGTRMVTGLPFPPDVDALRDIGYAQGLLDGNWLGDPSHLGAWRFYPPLVSAFRGVLFRLLGGEDLARFWVESSPWLNLLILVTGFGMARILFGGNAPAVTMVALLVLLNPVLGDMFATGGYSPWPAGPLLVNALFYAVLWLLLCRVAAARLADAALIGAGIGLAFQAHVVPAVVLTGIVTATAFAVQGLRWRSVGWLSVVAAVQLAVMAPYLLPVVLGYPNGVVHSSYEWVHGMLQLEPGPLRHLAAANLPGLIATVLAFAMRRRWPMPHPAPVVLLAWLAVPLLFIGRHYACGALALAGGGPPGGACRVFVVSVHHYHLYLQLGWTAVLAWVLWQVGREILSYTPPSWSPTGRRVLAVMLLVLPLGLGTWNRLRDPYDANAREEVLREGAQRTMDDAVYRWVLANTRPDALFVTEVTAPWQSSSGFAVIAAGRALVAAPELFSHPYLDWQGREAERQRLIAAVTSEDAAPISCDMARRGLWFVLNTGRSVMPARAETMLTTPVHRIFRARPEACG